MIPSDLKVSQAVNEQICAYVFNNYNTAIPCRHKLPKLIPYQHMTLHPIYKILNPILKSLPQIIVMWVLLGRLESTSVYPR